MQFSSYKIGFILTRNPQNKDELRSYTGLQAIGRVLGLNKSETSPDHLRERIERNKKRISGETVIPGVDVEWL